MSSVSKFNRPYYKSSANLPIGSVVFPVEVVRVFEKKGENTFYGFASEVGRSALRAQNPDLPEWHFSSKAYRIPRLSDGVMYLADVYPNPRLAKPTDVIHMALAFDEVKGTPFASHWCYNDDLLEEFERVAGCKYVAP